MHEYFYLASNIFNLIIFCGSPLSLVRPSWDFFIFYWNLTHLLWNGTYICLPNIDSSWLLDQPKLKSDYFIFSEISSCSYFWVSSSSMEGFLHWRWLKNPRWSSEYDLCIFLVIIIKSAAWYYNLAFAHFSVRWFKIGLVLNGA